MPLHDHPGMFVFCKVLKGKLLRHLYTIDNQNIQFEVPKKYIKVKETLI
jgi:hypothetical protein